jgi:hypothetical protein
MSCGFQARSQAEMANPRAGEGMGRSSDTASPSCVSRPPASSKFIEGDDESRSTETPKGSEEYEISKSFSTGSFIIREDIPEIDGRNVVVRKALQPRTDPFVTEFYRTSVTPFLE